MSQMLIFGTIALLILTACVPIFVWIISERLARMESRLKDFHQLALILTTESIKTNTLLQSLIPQQAPPPLPDDSDAQIATFQNG